MWGPVGAAEANWIHPSGPAESRQADTASTSTQSSRHALRRRHVEQLPKLFASLFDFFLTGRLSSDTYIPRHVLFLVSRLYEFLNFCLGQETSLAVSRPLAVTGISSCLRIPSSYLSSCVRRTAIRPSPCLAIQPVFLSSIHRTTQPYSTMGSVDSGPFDVKNIAIIGAGPCGLSAAKYLVAQQAFDSVVVFEQNPEVGGVWYYSREPTPSQHVPQVSPFCPPDAPVKRPDTDAPVFASPMYELLNTNIPWTISMDIPTTLFAFLTCLEVLIRSLDVTGIFASQAETVPEDSCSRMC